MQRETSLTGSGKSSGTRTEEGSIQQVLPVRIPPGTGKPKGGPPLLPPLTLQMAFVPSQTCNWQLTHLVKAVPKDRQRLVAQQLDQGGQQLQLLVGTHAHINAADGVCVVLQQAQPSSVVLP